MTVELWLQWHIQVLKTKGDLAPLINEFEGKAGVNLATLEIKDMMTPGQP